MAYPRLHLSLKTKDLAAYLKRQMNVLFPDRYSWDKRGVDRGLDLALQKTEQCFNQIKLPYFRKNGASFFNHLNTDQYAMFLYILSNIIWTEYCDESLAAKLMYLNKALHSVNCMYDTKLPDIFAFIHIVGTVIGKASYGNYLAIYQGVTIGTHNDDAPVIGECVSLLPHSAVVGKCRIGNRASVGLGTKLYGENVADDSIAITGDKGDLIIKTSTETYSDKIFSRKQNKFHNCEESNLGK